METIISKKPDEPVGGDPAQMPPPPPSSPRLGIASIILSILGIVFYCIPFSIGFFIGFSGNTDVLTSGSTAVTIMNIVGYCGNFLGLVGLVLGIISIVREEKKAFGIAGVVLSLLLTCGCLAGAAFNMLG